MYALSTTNDGHFDHVELPPWEPVSEGEVAVASFACFDAELEPEPEGNLIARFRDADLLLVALEAADRAAATAAALSLMRFMRSALPSPGRLFQTGSMESARQLALWLGRVL